MSERRVYQAISDIETRAARAPARLPRPVFQTTATSSRRPRGDIATHFLRNDYNEYYVEYRRRLNESYDVTALFRYDGKRNRFNEQSYGVWQRLGQTWAVKYEVSFFDGPRRESSFALNIEVELLKF